MTASQIIKMLNLRPHPEEGGYFTETYRSDETIDASVLPQRYSGSRNLGTAIYFLLTPDAFSAMHLLQSDEIFHFYPGDPIEMLHLLPDGSGRVPCFGNRLEDGMSPRVTVPKGWWQGGRLARGGEYALVGATVAPGFEFADYSHGNRGDLIDSCPQFEEMILSLTR